MKTKTKGKTISAVLVYFGILITVFFVIQSLLSTASVPVESADGLDGFDYSAHIARVEAACFEWYPSALYTPEDFSGGVAQSPEAITRQSGQHGTYRLVLDLPAGQEFGLSAYSATYAQKLWVNGALLSQVGTPGVDAASTVSKTGYYTVYFTAKDSPTEIIVQRAEYVHAQGGQLYPQFLGTQENITAMVDAARLRGGITVGCMLAATLFLLGFFFYFRGRRQFLWFALTCFSVAVRTLFIEQKLIMILFPGMGWGLSHRVEIVFTFCIFASFLLYLNEMFRWRLPRAVNGTVLGLGIAYLLFAMFSPSLVYTAILPWVQVLVIGWLAVSLVLLMRLMVKDKAYRESEQYLVLLSVLALAVFVLMDVVRYRFTGQYDDLNLTQTGITVFTFVNMTALVLNFSHTEQALAKTRRQAQELERLEQTRRAFLSNISHEMKTPLSVMSSYAQYTRVQMDDGTTGEDTRENLLTIALEAQRLSMLADQLLTESAAQTGSMGMSAVEPKELLARAAALCGPILQKQENRLESSAADGCPPVRANFDMMVQVLVNLCINASRHTHAGRVAVTAAPQAGMVVFRIEDNGKGIAPDLLPHVFERGVSGDGGTGLGLGICKDVVEAHGGNISIESSPGEGTKVTFTLPVDGAIQEDKA